MKVIEITTPETNTSIAVTRIINLDKVEMVTYYEKERGNTISIQFAYRIEYLKYMPQQKEEAKATYEKIVKAMKDREHERK